MARASLWRQLKVLLKRNLLLKKRVKSSTIQEIAFPLYFVIILAIIRVAVRPRTQPTIIGFPEHDLSKAFGQPNRNLTLTKIFITPDNLDTRTIGAGLATRLGLSPDSIVYFYNETTAVNAYVENPKNVFGIHFDKLQDNATSYELRVPIKSMPTALSNLYGSQGSCRSSTEGLAAFSCPANSYIFSGFANLQAVIDAEIIGLKGNRSFPSPKINVQMMPKGEFTPNVAWIQILSSIYLVMAYGPFVSFLASFLVFEKEKKIKENMKIMGLNGTAFWLSWFIIYTVLIFIVTIVVTLIGFLLFERSNLFLFFLMLMMYGLSIVNFGFILSTFFDKPQSASAVASLVPLIFSLLYLAVSLTRSYTIDGPVSSIPNVGQWFLCLLSPVALALSVDQGLYLDIARGGMNFETMHFGQFPLWSSLTMLAVDVVLYGLLAAYLDNVVPSEYGMKRPLWFCFMPSFWCPREIKEEDLILSEHGFEDNVTVEAVSGDIEPVSTEFKSKDVLRMFNIKKTFKGKKGANVVAVDGINMALYEGQITALLGHNGAGKTTLINMLTGLNPPTSGSATLYGLDVSDTNDMDQIRTMTGVCPQHNILFDKLSCVEHLVVFRSLRGIPEDQIEKQIENVLGDVDLSDQADTLAENLSGGQKRKLCVAIALIGSPKIIFLDEPTAGMDPYSRRHLWSLLKQRRKGRIIVLTTHFMDEADILADRKAVISKGKLRCCGSSMYLKNKFGIGYHLTMVVDGKHNTSAVTDLVHRHISSANLGHEHANELAYTLPHSKVEKFPELFSAIEKSQEANEDTPEYLGITSYGISMTTLEEVFLKLEEASVDDEPDVPNGPASDKDNDKPAVAINMQETPTANNVEFTANGLDSRACQIVEPVDLDKARFKTLVMLRFRIALRNPFSFTFRILFPALFVIIGVAVMRFSPAPVPVFEAAPKPFAISAFNYIASQGIPNTPYRYEDNTGGSPNVARMLADLSAITQVQEFNSSTDLLAVAPTNLASRFYAVNGPPGFDVNYTALYNDTAIHSLPSIINLISNSLLNLVLNDTNRPHQIMTANKPWPSIEVGSAQWNQAAFSSVILVGLAMTIVPAGMAGLIVKDRECKARSQLRVQGVTMNMYWGSTFLADIIQFCIPTLITVIAVLAFQVPSYRPGGAILSLILLYLLYMPVLTLCGYNISFLFNRFETAGAIIPQLFTYLSFVPYIPVSIVLSVVICTIYPCLYY
ncbi:unnamed protein product [Owenia fusiformis]|uniref:ABC transporter domain-containing protein n=1 Tax=Owenia fusiformis TaxID=6347 RepID=A0A8S4PPT1_OWEFU|nr:unnamed protein product [Owenia fusiformis]